MALRHPCCEPHHAHIAGVCVDCACAAAVRGNEGASESALESMAGVLIDLAQVDQVPSALVSSELVGACVRVLKRGRLAPAFHSLRLMTVIAKLVVSRPELSSEEPFGSHLASLCALLRPRLDSDETDVCVACCHFVNEIACSAAYVPHLIGLGVVEMLSEAATRHLAEVARDAPMPVVSQTAVFALSTLCASADACELFTARGFSMRVLRALVTLLSNRANPRPAEIDGRLCNLVRLAATHSNNLNFPAIAHAALSAMRAAGTTAADSRKETCEAELVLRSEIALALAAVVENPDHLPPRTSPMYEPICRVVIDTIAETAALLHGPVDAACLDAPASLGIVHGLASCLVWLVAECAADSAEGYEASETSLWAARLSSAALLPAVLKPALQARLDSQVAAKLIELLRTLASHEMTARTLCIGGALEFLIRCAIANASELSAVGAAFQELCCSSCTTPCLEGVTPRWSRAVTVVASVMQQSGNGHDSASLWRVLTHPRWIDTGDTALDTAVFNLLLYSAEALSEETEPPFLEFLVRWQETSLSARLIVEQSLTSTALEPFLRLVARVAPPLPAAAAATCDSFLRVDLRTDRLLAISAPAAAAFLTIRSERASNLLHQWLDAPGGADVGGLLLSACHPDSRDQLVCVLLGQLSRHCSASPGESVEGALHDERVWRACAVLVQITRLACVGEISPSRLRSTRKLTSEIFHALAALCAIPGHHPHWRTTCRGLSTILALPHALTTLALQDAHDSQTGSLPTCAELVRALIARAMAGRAPDVLECLNLLNVVLGLVHQLQLTTAGREPHNEPHNRHASSEVLRPLGQLQVFLEGGGRPPLHVASVLLCATTACRIWLRADERGTAARPPLEIGSLREFGQWLQGRTSAGGGESLAEEGVLLRRVATWCVVFWLRIEDAVGRLRTTLTPSEVLELRGLLRANMHCTDAATREGSAAALLALIAEDAYFVDAWDEIMLDHITNPPVEAAPGPYSLLACAGLLRHDAWPSVPGSDVTAGVVHLLETASSEPEWIASWVELLAALVRKAPGCEHMVAMASRALELLPRCDLSARVVRPQERETDPAHGAWSFVESLLLPTDLDWWPAGGQGFTTRCARHASEVDVGVHTATLQGSASRSIGISR